MTSFGAINHVKTGGTYTPLDSADGSSLVLGPYYSVPDDSNEIVFNYSIFNNGHTPGEDMLSAMVQAGLQGAAAAVSNGDDSVVVGAGQGIGSLLASFAGTAFANCDGLVAVYQSPTLTGGVLASMTASGSHYETIDTPGSDSPGGCGENSEYHTTWHIVRDNP